MGMVAETHRRCFAHQIELAVTRPSSPEDLERFAAPLLMINGAQDALTPPDLGAEIAAAALMATLRVIPGAGHFVLLEQAEETATAIADWRVGHL